MEDLTFDLYSYQKAFVNSLGGCVGSCGWDWTTIVSFNKTKSNGGEPKLV